MRSGTIGVWPVALRASRLTIDAFVRYNRFDAFPHGPVLLSPPSAGKVRLAVDAPLVSQPRTLPNPQR
jgi:hypothetical protein